MRLISPISSAVSGLRDVKAAIKAGSEPPKLSLTTLSLCAE